MQTVNYKNFTYIVRPVSYETKVTDVTKKMEKMF